MTSQRAKIELDVLSSARDRAASLLWLAAPQGMFGRATESDYDGAGPGSLGDCS